MAAPDHDHMRAILLESLRPFADALRGYAFAAADRPTWVAADSDAMRERSEERRWSTPDWLEPALNAHTFGQVLCHHVLDHADSYAAIATSAELGPSFAHATILRSVMDVSTTAGWLLEPRIGTERRIQRSIVYRIASAVHMLRVSRLDKIVAEATAAKRKATEYAEAQGWPVVKLERGRRSVGGEQMPAADRTFSEIVFGARAEASDGTLWHYLSATAHGTFYAVQQALAVPPGVTDDPLNPAGTVRAFAASTPNVMTLGRIVFAAARTIVERRDALNGWTATPEEVDAIRRLQEATVNAPVRFKP